MTDKVFSLEEHFLVTLTSGTSSRTLAGILDCLDEEAYRAIHTLAEALRGGPTPEAINSLILIAGKLLRRAAEQMPEWAEDAAASAREAAAHADDAGCELVRSLATQCWRETSRLILGEALSERELEG